MFDISFAELIVAAVVAVVVLGPKEIPVVMRSLGRWVGQAKALGNEFRQAVEEAVEDGKAQGEVKPMLTYIRDLEGELREAYDVSSLRPLAEGNNKPPLSHSVDSAATPGK